MFNASNSLQESQREAVVLLSRGAIVLAALIIGCTAALGGNTLFATVGGVAFAILGQLAPRLSPIASRVLVAQSLVGITITFNAALMGHPFQIDSHMLYFAVLAVVVMTTGIWALLFAAGTIAVHHLLLTFTVPMLVYPSADLVENLSRTVFHAVIVVMETGVLAFVIMRRVKMHRDVEESENKAMAAAQEAKDALASAKAEKERAEKALAEAQSATEQARVSSRQAQEALRANEEAEQERHELVAKEDAARELRDQALADLINVFGTHLDQLSSGDLSTRIEENLHQDYEGLRSSFNDALTRLSAAMHEVSDQSNIMQTQSGEISASANDLSTRTERQAAALATIAKSIKELNDALTAVATESEDAKSLAETTSSEADSGSSIMQQAVLAMRDIEGSSTEINKITGVIDDIAFQTNLLALNAGVEAARAGEAGRGFAVVASEVRALAQRSSDAAREINLLIGRSSTQISEGADLVDRTGQALNGIKDSVDKITSRLQSSAEAMMLQTGKLSQVSDSIVELEGVTQQNAAMFEETTAANAMLSSSAKSLSDMVSTFVTTPMTQDSDAVGQQFDPLAKSA